MIIFDKVPIDHMQEGLLLNMLNSKEFSLFRKCVESDMHAALLESGNLKYIAAKNTADSAKKEALAEIKEEEARRLAEFLHILDRLVENREFSLIKIQS